MNSQPTSKDIQEARVRIAPHVAVTPVSKALSLSEEYSRKIVIKWDNKLRTGSFKERGALNFLLSISPETRARGVCTASAGNHALGLSYHARRLGAPCTIVMPRNAPLVKVQACRAAGARIIFRESLADGLKYVQELATEEALTYIPPFNHELTVMGQGVAGLEVLEQVPDFDSVIIPIGGGGYAAGIATAIKSERPDVYVLGVCSEWALEARRNPESHAQRVPPMTIADGIAVKTIGTVTAPILERYVDAIVSVTESEIARGVISFLEHEHVVVEGSGAVGLAALAAGHLPGRCVAPVIFMSGSNIDTNLLSRLIEQNMAERGRLLRLNVSLPDKPGMLHLITGIVAAGGANVLQVLHDRFYARFPGHVDITVIAEVRDRAHGVLIIEELRKAGVPTSEG